MAISPVVVDQRDHPLCELEDLVMALGARSEHSRIAGPPVEQHPGLAVAVTAAHGRRPYLSHGGGAAQRTPCRLLQAAASIPRRVWRMS